MDNKKADLIYFVLVIWFIVALPLGISAYDRYSWNLRIPQEAKVFDLTGNTQKGWVSGHIEAADVLIGSLIPRQFSPPVITVNKGDRVILRLASSDVVHGFSLKDFDIFVNDGIHPGKPQIVSFIADKAGTFTFACNSICGSLHENMSGTILVNA
ncbi:MAG: cupredoxin domain-containing protein [Proteobacteria bacterium]|nr:cupredoxin domain-containing protein [Pseudomonadota bacterium]MBU1585476.1 cupredoxin domain-containing protein [Pseudomonadota bacterium]MBU2454804.1 cupredoxin domain-containing protein [Pseudomonadota bacterium]MBU2627820.1 cupredoxin domain-containing protein [Pseudomonadota bacterium]